MDITGLAGESVRLVPSEASTHLENAILWMNDPEVTARLHMITGVTRRQEELFFERMATQRETDLHWAIMTEEFGHIGFIALHQINWQFRLASGGIMIGERRAWGRGFATDAVRVRTRFAFDQLGIHRIEGQTINPAMRRVYERAGYLEEGVARKKVWRGGRWHDVSLHAMLDDDFYGRSAETRDSAAKAKAE
jgi:RimJ/RimL family protein N-acetyltransferase